MTSSNYGLFFQQPIDYILVTGAGSCMPVTLANTKAWLKIPSTLDADDGLITALIKASTGYFEKITGRDLITKTYKTYLDAFPVVDNLYYFQGVSSLMPQYKDNGIYLRKSVLQAITSIEYYVDGVLVTWGASNYYTTQSSDYSAIYLALNKNFPTDVDFRKQAIKITFTAGYGDCDANVPDDIQQALFRFINYLYAFKGVVNIF